MWRTRARAVWRVSLRGKSLGGAELGVGSTHIAAWGAGPACRGETNLGSGGVPTAREGFPDRRRHERWPLRRHGSTTTLLTLGHGGGMNRGETGGRLTACAGWKTPHRASQGVSWAVCPLHLGAITRGWLSRPHERRRSLARRAVPARARARRCQSPPRPDSMRASASLGVRDTPAGRGDRQTWASGVRPVRGRSRSLTAG